MSPVLICYSIHPEFISRFSSTLQYLFPNQSIRIGRSSLDKLSSKAFRLSRYVRVFQDAPSRPLSSPTRKCYRPCCARVSGSTLFFSGSGVVRFWYPTDQLALSRVLYWFPALFRSRCRRCATAYRGIESQTHLFRVTSSCFANIHVFRTLYFRF